MQEVKETEMGRRLRETEMSRRLREHRAGHPECDGLHCKPYLDIARDLTARRVIWEGPRTPYSRLSIQEE
jgi:hypothetical protein